MKLDTERTKSHIAAAAGTLSLALLAGFVSLADGNMSVSAVFIIVVWIISLPVMLIGDLKHEAVGIWESAIFGFFTPILAFFMITKRYMS